MTKQNLEKEYCNERGDSSFNDYNNNDYTKWLETKLIETEKQLNLSGVGSSVSEFEKDLFELIHNYCKNGLKKPELVKKMEWVLGSCKMS